jgi:Ca2+-transporting ATPase
MKLNDLQTTVADSRKGEDADDKRYTKGLSSAEVLQARDKYGVNRFDYNRENGLIRAIKDIAKEPMLLLLLAASLIYFISGKSGDGIFLGSAIILVAAISLYQDKKSRDALEKLEDFTQPSCKVIRNGITEEIKSDELVVGDSLIVEEGTLIAADGIIIHSNDFSVNESILTGESLSVYKDQDKEDNLIFSGTTVTSGLAIARVTAIARETRLGKIGRSLEEIKEEKTPLELQISNFVKKMVIAGAVVFLIVWVINFLNFHNILDSLLKALTLAMSILPEEIPVAFTTFMALGAWRLMKMGIVVKQMKTVETLGSATVICTDKTGTITENRMSLKQVFSFSTGNIAQAEGNLTADEKEVVRIAMWASEPIPFDPMELALHDAYAGFAIKDERPEYKMVHEYPLGGKPPMMTHMFENAQGRRIVAAKGAPEAFLEISDLTAQQKQQIHEVIQIMAADGYRLLGVAESNFTGNDFPAQQQELKFRFKGIVAFYDPPKANIHSVFDAFYKAGLSVKIVTGDNTVTTSAIAKQTGFKGWNDCLTGEELMKLQDGELEEKVISTNLFTRMFPDAKLKIIRALKAKGQVVAMTGDGVNDAPALKAAHIGIAMGQKGTEIARQAASLILLEDDLSKMVDAVAMGRKIYTNLKKAIQYIISIHIPIILTVFVPLALGWLYPNIFSPVHIIFLELIMGPTCSIVYENEPMEADTMLRKPRPFTDTFFNWRELITSIAQGVAITAATLTIYRYAVGKGYDEALTRTMVFTTLIAANIFLTLVNRSFHYSILTTLRYKNYMVFVVISITIAILALLLLVRVFTDFFGFEHLSSAQLLICTGAGFISVMWYEIVKWKNRRKQ